MNTMCDKCGCALDFEDANDAPPGEWEGATLCGDCYAEVADE